MEILCFLLKTTLKEVSEAQVSICGTHSGRSVRKALCEELLLQVTFTVAA